MLDVLGIDDKNEKENYSNVLIAIIGGLSSLEPSSQLNFSE